MSVVAAAYLHVLQSFDAALGGTALNSQLVETLCIDLFVFFKKRDAAGRKERKGETKRIG